MDSWTWILISVFALTIGAGTYAYFRFFWAAPLAPELRREPIFEDDNFVQLRDCKIHYSVKGRGKPIILLHGWGANIFCWRLLTPLLSKHYQVFELDLPGFGLSTKTTNARYGLDDQCRRIVDFMDALKISKANFVGSSMGGALSLWMGVAHAGRVLAVLVLSPAAHYKVLPTALHYFSGLGHFAPRFVRKQIGMYSLRQVLSRQELINEESLSGYLGPFLAESSSSVTLLKAAEAIRDPRLPSELKKILVPVKVLYGERDNVIKRYFVEDMLKHLPANTQYKTHPTAGHHSQEDEPQWVFEEIQNFFDV